MAYKPTIWKDQIEENPTRYKIVRENGVEETVNINKAPGEIIQEGTRFTASKMNNIEKGIKGAADLVNDLAGSERTTETVKKNAEDITSVSSQMAELATKTGKIIGDDGNLYNVLVENNYINNFEVEATRSILTDQVSFDIDDEYMYLNDSSGNLQKINKITHETVVSKLIGSFMNLIVDNDYIYLTKNKTIVKYNKSDLSLVATSPTQADYIPLIALDDNYVYITGNNMNYITKLNKSNLSLVGQSASTFENTSWLAVEGDYIYCDGGDKITKLDKTNFMTVASVNRTTHSSLGYIAMDNENIYIYFAKKLIKLSKSTLSTLQQVPCRITNSILIYGNYIYTTHYSMVNYSKVTLSEVEEYNSGVDMLDILAIDNDYFYIAKTIPDNSSYRSVVQLMKNTKTIRGLRRVF